jgi:hypothetical protein
LAGALRIWRAGSPVDLVRISRGALLCFR